MLVSTLIAFLYIIAPACGIWMLHDHGRMVEINYKR